MTTARCAHILGWILCVAGLVVCFWQGYGNFRYEWDKDPRLLTRLPGFKVEPNSDWKTILDLRANVMARVTHLETVLGTIGGVAVGALVYTASLLFGTNHKLPDTERGKRWLFVAFVAFMTAVTMGFLYTSNYYHTTLAYVERFEHAYLPQGARATSHIWYDVTLRPAGDSELGRALDGVGVPLLGAVPGIIGILVIGRRLGVPTVVAAILAVLILYIAVAVGTPAVFEQGRLAAYAAQN